MAHPWAKKWTNLGLMYHTQNNQLQKRLPACHIVSQTSPLLVVKLILLPPQSAQQDLVGAAVLLVGSAHSASPNRRSSQHNQSNPRDVLPCLYSFSTKTNYYLLDNSMLLLSGKEQIPARAKLEFTRIYSLSRTTFRAVSFMVSSCAAHSSRRLLARHLKTCSLVTLLTSRQR